MAVVSGFCYIELTLNDSVDNQIPYIAQYQLAVNAEGDRAVVLYQNSLPDFIGTELFTQQLRIGASRIASSPPKKISTNANDVRQYAVAYDARSGRFLAVWEEALRQQGNDTNIIFRQRYNKQGKRVGGRKAILSNGFYYSPFLANVRNAAGPDEFHFTYKTEDLDSPAVDGLYYQTLNIEGDFTSDPVKLLDLTFGFQPLQTAQVLTLGIFEHIRGTIVFGLYEQYFTSDNVFVERIFTSSIRPNGTIVDTPSLLSYPANSSFVDQIHFGRLSETTFTAAHIDADEAAIGFEQQKVFFNMKKRAGQQRFRGEQFDGNTMAFVYTEACDAYAVVQRAGGMQVLAMAPNGKIKPAKSEFYTFESGVQATHSSIAAAHLPQKNAILVVFHDKSSSFASDTRGYAAYLPLPYN